MSRGEIAPNSEARCFRRQNVLIGTQQSAVNRRVSRKKGRLGRPKKYIPTRRTDAIIKSAYLEFRRRGDHSTLRRAASSLNWPRYAVSRRATELGVSVRIHDRPWSKTELVVLQQAVQLGAESIRRRLNARGFKRSLGSILAKRKSIQSETNRGQCSARQAALGLGIDPHKVSQWIRRGLLVAKRAGYKGSRWSISLTALRDFVFEHPEHIDLAQADKTWLLGVLKSSA